MTSIVSVTVPTRHTAEVRGRRALDLLKRAALPKMFSYAPPSGGCPCWTCPATRVADLVAAADLARGVRVVLHHEQGALL